MGCDTTSDGETVKTRDETTEAERMVRRQIEGRGVEDPEVLRAMSKVPRHEFVPESLKGSAYSDSPLPIGHGQTISQPYIVGFMTEALDLQPGERVLEIGTGSGYQAAILAEMGARVYSIEIIPELGEFARKNLARTGYESVHLRVGDGFQGWPEAAPFDAIIVTCSPNDVPDPLEEQLAEGGCMIIPVGSSFSQELVLLEKKGGKLTRTHRLPVRFVPMVDEEGERY